MKNMKIKVLGTLVFVFGITLAVVGVASASQADTLQPASVITYDEEVVVNDTIRVDSAYIGQQDVGGVTFFNGTIVNSTTGTDDADNPVTFGDDVRIDGQIYRTEVGGDNPLKLADSIRPQTTNVYDLGTTDLQMKDGYFAGTVNVGALGGTGVVSSANLANDAVTGAKIAAGTIVGSDISSSAALSVASVATSGNVVATGNVVGIGAAKALVNIASDGSCVKSWTFDGSSVTCAAGGILGAYNVTFGSGFDLTNSYLVVSAQTSGGYAASANASTSTNVAISMYSDVGAGTLAQAYSYLVVY